MSLTALALLVLTIYAFPADEELSVRYLLLVLAMAATWAVSVYVWRTGPVGRQAHPQARAFPGKLSSQFAGRNGALIAVVIATYGLAACAVRPEPHVPEPHVPEPQVEEPKIDSAKAAPERHDKQAKIDELTATIESSSLPDSELAMALKSRGILRINLSFELQDGDERYFQALQDLNQAIKIEPYDSESYIIRARAYYYLGAYEEAFSDLDVATALQGEDAAWPLIERASYLRMLGEFDASLAVFQELFDLYGTEPIMPIYYNMAQTLMDMGRPKDAEEAIDNGLPGQPDYRWAYFYRGCARARQGKLGPALADYEHGFDLWAENADGPPDSPMGRHNLSQLRREAQAIRDALADLAGPAPVMDTCRNFWADLYSGRRERSRLLAGVPDN